MAIARAHLEEPNDGRRLLSGPLLAEVISMPPTMIRGPCWFAAARLAVAIDLSDVRLEALLDLIRPFTGRIITLALSTLQGPADHTIGMLAAHVGHRVEAEACFERAVEMATRFGNELWSAHAQVALAALRRDERGLSVARQRAERAGIVDLSGDHLPALCR